MRISIPRFLKRKEEDQTHLEIQLQAALQPVAPRDNYVQALRRNLIVQLGVPAPTTSMDTRNILILIGAGFLSGLLALVLSVRAIVTLIAAIGLLYQFKRQIEDKSPTSSLPPAV